MWRVHSLLLVLYMLNMVLLGLAALHNPCAKVRHFSSFEPSNDHFGFLTIHILISTFLYMR